MNSKCPICQKEMIAVPGDTIGRLPGRPDMDLKNIIGYNCPTQNDLPHGAKTPHFTSRGRNEILTVFPYRVSSWVPDAFHTGSKGVSTIYAFNKEDGQFTEAAQTPLIKWEDEERMLEKLAIYILFS